MGVIEYFNESPFRELVGVEITEAADGHAEGRLPLGEEHSSNDRNLVAQGGVAFTLADSVGGAAAVSLHERPTPTIDFRIDYLAPATADLRATGDVVRNGRETSLVDVEVHDVSGELVARGTGVYKTSDLGGDAPWDLGQE
jgi:uncharacterized protein (TIGR00369 family)